MIRKILLYGFFAIILIAFLYAILFYEPPKQNGTSSASSDAAAAAVSALSLENLPAEIKVVFLEIGSKGCVPCDMMQPILKDIEETYSDSVKVIFADIKTTSGSKIAKQFRVQIIPTQVFLDRDGKEYFRHVGYLAKDKVVETLRKGGVE